jgi:taurine dioxygenase
MAVIDQENKNTTSLRQDFIVEPVTGSIGAVIRGVRLNDGLSDSTLALVRAALVRHKVIFFRDQHLTDEAHEDFTARLGRPLEHSTLPVAEGSRYLLNLDPMEALWASMWHTDMTFTVEPPEASILRCLVAPAVGGDTLWANCVTAYENLPPVLRQLADTLSAVHTNEYDFTHVYDFLSTSPSGAAWKQILDENIDRFKTNLHEAEHPVVRVHPESGERALMLGHFVKAIVGLNKNDSQRLISIFQDHILKVENCVRWRWQTGDVAVWDNRATQHRVSSDFGEQDRQMRRSTIMGPVPVGIDGRMSRQIKPRLEPTAMAAE